MLTLNDGRDELWQWDTGRTLAVDADCSQVHFSNKVFGRSIDVDVVDGTAIIPDILLQTDKDLNVWAFVGTEENGYTKISKTFKVNRRNKPADYVFTPTDQMTLQTIQSKIGDLADLTTEAKDTLVAAINEAARTGGGSGSMDLRVADGYVQYSTDGGMTWTNLIAMADLKGADGVTPHIGDNGNWYLGPTDTGKPSRGEKGRKGNPGTPGAAGHTPVKGTDYWTASDKEEVVAEAAAAIDLTPYAKKTEVPTKTSQLTNDSGFLTSHQDISGKQDKATLEADVSAAGFTKNTGTYSKPTGGIPKADLAEAVQTSLSKADTALQSHQSLAAYRTAAAQDEIDNGKVDKVAGKGLSTNDYNATEKSNNASNTSARHSHSNKALLDGIDAAKISLWDSGAQQTPLFANSTADCTDTTKVYVLPDGYIYGYISGAWTNTGHQFTNAEALEKVIDATCDIETIQGGNYNLLKVSEVSFSSRLQNDTAGIIASTATNVVTGWIPVTYGKYYCPSTKLNDVRTVYRISIPRVQLKLADDTIAVYAANVYPIDSTYRTLAVENPNAVAMRLQFQIMNSSSIAQDISTSEKIKAFEPMIVEGSTVDEAYNNSLNFDYLDGDAEIPAIVNYTLKHDFTKADKAYVDSLFSVMVDGTSMLHKAQKYIAEDWRIPFVDAPSKLGLGSNHIIPASYNIWGGTGNDLDQKSAMMQDGVHPYLAVGGNYMYAQAVAAQISVLPPLYSESSEHDDWQCKSILWTGASLTAGSDPYAPGVQTPYPTMVATRLGATSINIAKGSSCVRVNASDGVYSMFKYSHFIRALSRTVSEADWVQANWNTIKTNMIEAPATIPSADVEVMKQHSFENLLLPYLNGTHPMPDLFIFDHGHNDVRPRGVDGKQDSLVLPTASNIASGVLAEDTYMTANNYANLKLALNNDLSRVPKLTDFVASLNRNCYIGAMNFLFTLIYRYNPKARIILISDYN